nr:ribonuclease H-like domain-containing protein [Tanacetum cinerariifolium]
MILNTLDNLEKFEAKGDEGYFIRYSMSSKAFRVHDALLESSSSKPQDDCSTDAPESSRNSNPTATSTNPPADQLETLIVETPIPTVCSPLLTACLNDSLEPLSDTRLISKRVSSHVETPSMYNILTLTNRFEGILGVTTHSVDSDGVEADVRNMEITITASHTPTLRIHKDHPKSQIIGHVDTPIQTSNKSKETLVDCPKGVTPIGTKWVLKNKKDERGIVIRNKARLVAQGHMLGIIIPTARAFCFCCQVIISAGNSAKSMTTNNDGNLKIRPPVTSEEHQQVKREEKARTILLSVLPDEHIGNSAKSMIIDNDGNIKIRPHVTSEEHQQ